MGTKRFHTDCPIPNCYTYYPKKKERILKRNKKENLQKISLIYLVYQIKHSILKLRILIFFIKICGLFVWFETDFNLFENQESPNSVDKIFHFLVYLESLF